MPISLRGWFSLDVRTQALPSSWVRCHSHDTNISNTISFSTFSVRSDPVFADFTLHFYMYLKDCYTSPGIGSICVHASFHVHLLSDVLCGVVGKKGQYVWTEGDDSEALSRGVYNTYTSTNLRYSQVQRHLPSIPTSTAPPTFNTHGY